MRPARVALEPCHGRLEYGQTVLVRSLSSAERAGMIEEDNP